MNDKKSLVPTLFLLGALFYILTGLEWGIFHGFINRNPDNIISAGLFTLYDKLVPNSMIIRLITCVIMGLAFWVLPSPNANKKDQEENRMWVYITAISLVGIYSLGFRTIMIYSLFIFPVVSFATLYFVMKAMSSLNKLVDKSYVPQVSCNPENEMSFDFATDLGTLRVDSPQQGIGVDSGAGGGKSFNIIEPIIFQAAFKNFAAFIYDFKGNPATLSKVAYSALVYKKRLLKEKNRRIAERAKSFFGKILNFFLKLKAEEIEVKFGFINFVDMGATVRCNPLAPKYLLSDLHVTESATTLMLNLNKSWIEKRDFWADNAISILDATIKYQRKHHPTKCSLPHVISLILNNYEGLLNYLAQDKDIQKVILPVLVAHQKNAAGQTAGAISSIQLPLQKLYTPTIYWVLSADEFSLDITNKKEPKMFCIANDPSLMEALSPCIALITSVCMQQMNQQGKNKSLFCVDELPTIFINKLDHLPATARSNKVVTCLAYQSFAQLERDYGPKNAEIIQGNLGNMFYGMTNELKTAEKVVKTFGDHKVKKYSYSESDSGLSESYSHEKETIFQARDVMGQPKGHFMGRIAGGNPPLFSVQMPPPGKRPMDKMELVDIPRFSAFENDPNDEKLNKLVMENFIRINKEAEDLITPHIPVPETDEE